MVDKDFVAVDYANRNAAAIAWQRPRPAQQRLRPDPADLRFDLIASNIPAKVGKELLAILSARRPRPAAIPAGGSMWSPSTGCANS